MKRKIMESLFVLAVVILFIFPAVSSTSMQPFFSSRNNFNIYHQSDEQKAPWYIQHPYDESSMSDGRLPVVINEKSSLSTSGPMDSSWPMYCHDTHHTGRSPYSTAENPPGVMKWRFENDRIGALYGSSVIDKNGIIYFGGLDFFAVYPNGTVKWRYMLEGRPDSIIIGHDGVVYGVEAIHRQSPSQCCIFAFGPAAITTDQTSTTDWLWAIPIAVVIMGIAFFAAIRKRRPQ